MTDTEMTILQDAASQLHAAGFSASIVQPPAGTAYRCIIGGNPDTYVFVSGGEIHFSAACSWAPAYLDAIYPND